MAARVDWLPRHDTDRRILRAALAATFAGILVKLAATLKEITVAGIYGRTDAMEAFLAAALIPGLLVNLIAESMNQALIPTLVRVRETEGRQQAQELLSSAMFWSCLFLTGSSILMALAAPISFPLIASHFNPAKLQLAESLFYGMLPIIVLTGIASNCTAVLNTLDRFALPALAPVLIPLATIVGASLLSARLGIWAMVFATSFGALLQAAWMAWMMQAKGYKLRLAPQGMNPAGREVAKQYGPVLLSSVVASGGLLVDQSMAASLPAGSVSALAYANRFVSVVITLMAGTVASALTPSFSTMVAHADWAGCKRTIRTWVRILALVTVPIALGLMLGSRLLIRLAFQHGVFGPKDTAAVAPVLVMYALQIPFFVCSRVYYRFLLAMRRTDLIFRCGVANLALDVVFNLVFMRIFGVAGIALATSVWTISTLLFLYYWSRRLLAAKTGAAE
ncbi:MAG TPA: lipid II flippase MurJ [Terracidiphilus sp.]|nr:lipid II flippase MurJ [Terracidiphilus sp.]